MTETLKEEQRANRDERTIEPVSDTKIGAKMDNIPIKHFKVMPFGISLERIDDKLAVWISYWDGQFCVLQEGQDSNSREKLHEDIGAIILALTLKMEQHSTKNPHSSDSH